MILFLDASALVAMIAGEPEALLFESRLSGATERLYSAVSGWEMVFALCGYHGASADIARIRVRDFVAAFDIRLVPIASMEQQIALDAYETYGKGRHPARLNMGDCFAYACGRANGAKLLYKGDDFIHTDMA